MSVQTRIERVYGNPSGKATEYKQLRREGWDVVALVAPDCRSVVFLACRGSVT